jgi:hypothetical protein
MKKVLLFSFLLSFYFSNAQKLQGQAKIDSLLIEVQKTKIDTLKINLYSSLADEHYYIDIEKSFGNLELPMGIKVLEIIILVNLITKKH